MVASPVIEWRIVAGPNTVITSQAMTGSGFSGAIPISTSSSVTQVRIYNNYLAAAGIADATNCILATYDDVTHQGTAITGPTLGDYLAVQVIDYNGVATGADTLYYPIGGATKHLVPVNTAILSGTGANYFTINLQLVIPMTGTQGALSQGLWLEFSSIA
jgi:hypothetical protein